MLYQSVLGDAFFLHGFLQRLVRNHYKSPFPVIIIGIIVQFEYSRELGNIADTEGTMMQLCRCINHNIK